VEGRRKRKSGKELSRRYIGKKRDDNSEDVNAYAGRSGGPSKDIVASSIVQLSKKK